MITPLFSISQTETALHLSIRAPHSRPRDIELSATDHDFHFYTSPYLLHLRFEHPVDLPPSPLQYNLETGIATVALLKREPHLHFARLDMLSTLLVTRARAAPSIEVLSSATATEAAAEPAVVPLTVGTPSGLLVAMRELSVGRPRYGFAARHEAVFAARAEDASQIVDLPHPDDTPVWRRPALRRAAEDAKFCPQHYMADFLAPQDFAHVLAYTSPPCHPLPPLPHRFVDALLKLPRREYLQDVDASAAADLAGLLFAAAYDTRFTLGERNVESAWTVSRICPTTAFLESFSDPRHAVVAAYRRSLAYPLFRSTALADAVLADLKMMLSIGNVDELRARLLRALLELKEVFEGDKLLRVHCDLFLIDYCVWVQKVDDAVLERLRDDVVAMNVDRRELGWDLDALETKARRLESGEECDDDTDDDAIAPYDSILHSPVTTGSLGAREIPEAEVSISALSKFPMPELMMKAVATRRFDEKRKRHERDTSDSSSDEYDSSSSESSTGS